MRGAPALDRVAYEADSYVLQSRISDSARLEGSSRYRDEIWDLTPGMRQLHVKPQRLIWSTFPPEHLAAAKALTFAMISLELPGEQRPDLVTIRTNFTYMKKLAEWLVDHNVKQIRDLTAADLRQYCADNVKKSYDTQSRMQRAVSRFWDYRENIEDALKLNPRRLDFWSGGQSYPREGKTPRIPEEVLTPLIGWAIRLVEAGPQIVALNDEYEQLRTSRPKYGRLPNKQHERERILLARDRVLAVLDDLRISGCPLPGNAETGLLRRETSPTAPAGGVNYSHIARMAGVPNDVASRIARKEILEAAEELGIAEGSFLTGTVKIDGIEARIAYREWAVLRNHLQTACYIVVSFFTGMRDSEVKHLERGCARLRTDSTGALRRHEVRGLTFKGSTIKPAGRRATWVTAAVVHQAISVLQQLIPVDVSYLFAPLREGTNADRGDPRAVATSGQTNSALARFILAANSMHAELGLGQHIPIASSRPISTSMFRRTLAWFIARRPGGVIAGALQYQHHSVQMFEGYAGESESGFLEEVEANRAMLRFESFVIDRESHSMKDLRGPAEAEARRRIASAEEQMRFRGVIVEDDYQLADILEIADVNMHESAMVICVMDPDKAACRRGAVTPDWDGCRPMDCNNAVFTPEHLLGWRREARDLDVAIEAGVLAPAVSARLRPRRDKILKVLQKVGY